MMNAAHKTLDAQINDYLLTASGHLKEPKTFVDGRQVASFAAAVGSGLAMMSQAEASVVANAGTSRPVTVSAPFDGTSYANIDMNGDAIDDFALFGADRFYSSPGYYTHTTSSSIFSSPGYSFSSFSAGINGTPGSASNSVMGASNVQKLYSGNSIGPSGTWNVGGGTSRDVFFNSGNGASNWNGANGEIGYAGVRFKIGGNTHYGWIKLQLNNAGSLTATEWAYESCPDTPIVAGATSGGPASCQADPQAPPTQVPVMTPLAYGLTSLALGSLGLAGLRRRRATRQVEPTRH